MSERDSIRNMWVLEHVNSRQFFGRFNGHWTRTGDLDVAAIWSSPGEAENALQALKQEAADRLAKAKEHWPSQMWWDVHGGLVVVREIEVITRLVEPAVPPAPLKEE